MINFIYGIQAILASINLHFYSILDQGFLKGFIFGVVLASLISALVITRSPRKICAILLHRTSDKSWQRYSRKNYKKLEDEESDLTWEYIHGVTRLIFAIAVFMFFLISIIAIFIKI